MDTTTIALIALLWPVVVGIVVTNYIQGRLDAQRDYLLKACLLIDTLAKQMYSTAEEVKILKAKEKKDEQS